MPLVRGLIHVLSFAAVGALAVAFGRWLRDPGGGFELILLVSAVVVVVACVRRLYGPAGLAAPGLEPPAREPPGATAPLAAPRATPPSAAAEPLWAPREENATPARAARVPAPARVDLNRASRAELLTLPGVGAATAERIVAARPFASVADLARVPGFSPAKVRVLADLVKI